MNLTQQTIHADRRPVILAEISNFLVIRKQPTTREPHHLNVASGFALKPAAEPG
jgi:hypothetical protein